MAEKVPRATHAGPLKIADIGFDCAVLEDGRRVVSETKFMQSMGMYRSGALSTRRKGAGAPIPLFLAYKNLIPFAEKHLGGVHYELIKFKSLEGGSSRGIDATLIPKVCEIWIDADRAGVLGPRQQLTAKKADILLRGFAHVGIIALVDEATGYQLDRDRQDLQKILAAYISEELMPWTKMFPDEFYRELFRLRGWQYHPISVKRPLYVGKLTNELIYEKLPEGVLDDLRRKNPVSPKTKRRKHKFFQFLTEDVGNPHLQKQLVAVITLMKVSPRWSDFMRMFARAFPEPNQAQELPFSEEQGRM